MVSKILYLLACLVFPIVWGVIINLLFNLWQSRSTENTSHDDSIFPDYQI